jgi:hypothetical protein
MVCGLRSVRITACDKLGTQGWAPLSHTCRIRAGLVFMARVRPYLHVPQLYRKLWLKVSERAGPRRDRSILEDRDDHGGIL